MNEHLHQYMVQHQERHLEELKQFLRIPSISAVSLHKPDIEACAQWLASSLKTAGMEHVQIMPTEGHPIVYADWLHAPGQPTVLVYGHYDVQPAEPLEAWLNPPFEPEVRGGKLYARGATDDKGQVFIYVKAVEALINILGQLPINVKFCIEGEEEVASPSLAPFVQANKELLAADFIMVSDNAMLDKGKPSLEYAMRGLAAFEIEVRGANTDLHSGLYGGGVPNAIHALTELMASFHTPDGKIAVEGMYKDVLELSAKEKEALSRLPHSDEQVRKELDLEALTGEQGFTYIERTTARPTFEITSITGGFQGEGIKPIIPAEAKAKVACRLVPDQNPEQVMNCIEEHIRKNQPKGVKVNMIRKLKGNPFLSPIDHPLMVKAAEALEEVFGEKTSYTRSGGSIPIVDVFSKTLSAPVVLIGFGLPGENLHAPNENFDLENFRLGAESIFTYWEKIRNAE
ncbi:dipeptidase [Paenibacillus larvae]